MKKLIIPAGILCHLLAWDCFAPLDLEGLAPPPEKKPAPAEQAKQAPKAATKKIQVPEPENQGEQAATPRDRKGFNDVILFANDDKLHGRLTGIASAEGALTFQHPSARGDIQFNLDAVRRVTLATDLEQKKPVQNATVKLTNGDVLAGNVVSMNDETLVMDTWYAGRINVEKVMVTTLRPNAEGSMIVYEGPTDLENWTISDQSMQNAWRLKNGALYPMQSHPIGREIEGMPDVASIEFECSWRGYPAFNFVFYTDNIEKVSGNYYMLQVSSSSVYMRRYTRNQGSQNMWNLNHNDFSNNRGTNARFTLLINKQTRSFSLLVDGVMLKQWTDPGSFAGMGNGIMFAPQNAGGMKFFNIRVSEWDGTIPQPDEEEKEEQKDDQVQFVNKDKVSGTLLGIENGSASFKTEFATMNVPLDRIGEVLFSQEEAERARRNKNDVILTFAKHGTLTIQLNKIENNTVFGESENFGAVEMPLDAFREIELNIYEKRDDDEESFDF